MPAGERYICEVCGHRQATSGDCPKDAGEPLQDLANEDVRLMLDGFDSARKRKRYYLLGIGAAILTAPVVVLVPVRKIALVVWVLCAGALTTALYKFFPARKVLPDLDAEAPDWLQTAG
jgi:hypothetical protein